MNKYLTWYNQLIETHRNINILGYNEKHHIIPKCMGGTDEKNNIIPLTAKAHYVAHHLLHKAYPNNKKLANAFGMMLCSGGHQQRKFTSKMYENARKALSVARRGTLRPDLAENNRKRRKHPLMEKKQRIPNREAFKVYNALKKINGFTAEEIEQKRKARLPMNL